MNKRGRGSGLALALILIVALVVAWLAVTNRASLGMGSTAQTQRQEDAVNQAQRVVEQMNERMQQAVPED